MLVPIRERRGCFLSDRLQARRPPVMPPSMMSGEPVTNASKQQRGRLANPGSGARDQGYSSLQTHRQTSLLAWIICARPEARVVPDLAKSSCHGWIVPMTGGGGDRALATPPQVTKNAVSAR